MFDTRAQLKPERPLSGPLSNLRRPAAAATSGLSGHPGNLPAD